VRRPPLLPDRRFDGLAEAYERWEALTGDPVAEWLPGALARLGGPRHRAVDLTCGGGRHAVLLADAFETVLANDLSAEMVEHARRVRPRPNVAYRAGDLHAVAGSFDLVLTAAALHDVPDLDAALRHVRRLVGPGGAAIVVDVVADRPRLRGPMPRSVVRASMLGRLVGDLVRRDRDALARYRAGTHPAWLEHLASDRLPLRGDLARRIDAVMPGARHEPLQYLHAAVWRAPG
jgi:ubiquinone/menaquinone biosynthesis C-methylase UbiE